MASGGHYVEADLVRMCRGGSGFFMICHHMGCLHVSAMGGPGAGPARVHVERGVGHIQCLLARWHESTMCCGCDLARGMFVSIVGGVHIRAPHGLFPSMFNQMDVQVHLSGRRNCAAGGNIGLHSVVP